MRGVRRSDAQFLQHLEDNSIPIPVTGCLIWMGALTPNGYPRATHNGQAVQLHRFRCKGLKPRQVAMHTCDIRCCIAEEHLVATTQMANIQDSVKKGRHSAVNKHKGWANQYLKRNWK